MKKFDICICPGCGIDLPLRNRGCTACSYLGPGGRVPTVRSMLNKPNYPSADALSLNNVSSLFLRRLVDLAVSGAATATALPATPPERPFAGP